MNIRRLSIEDRDACARVTADRGWSTPLAQWEMLLRHGQGYGVEHDGILAGTVITLRYETLAFIGMMLMRQEVEGRGFGRALLAHALEREHRPAALIATPRGQPLYESLGFIPREEIAVYKGVWNTPSRLDALVHEPASLSRRDVESIVQTDADAFGCRRDRLIAGMLDRARRVALIEDADRSWHAFATEETDAIVIGPIIAPNDEISLRLISALVSPGDTVRIRIVASRATLCSTLNEAGLSVERALPLMTRGGVSMPNDAWRAVAMMATG